MILKVTMIVDVNTNILKKNKKEQIVRPVSKAALIKCCFA